MIELFANIPEYVKNQTKFWVDLALQQKDLISGAKMVADYAKTCQNEEERDFVDFYFNLRIQELINENASNIRESR